MRTRGRQGGALFAGSLRRPRGDFAARAGDAPFLRARNRANSNTFVCRQLHSLLTPLRPQVHCPHTSPTGGMTCVDFPYHSFYTTTLFDFAVTPVEHGH